MTRILILWEDLHHDKLDRCLRRAIRHLGIPSPDLSFANCRGNGGFLPYLSQNWLRISRSGLVKSGGPIHHLVCVADADRAHECCSVENPATVSGATATWLARATEAWTQKLRGGASVSPERIHGHFLRWNQESLLIAAHDVEEALTALGCRDHGKVRSHLAACQPSPTATPDPEFADRFRRPERCLTDLLKAAGARVHAKGTPPRGDALEAASARAIDRLCARVPDLPSLARLVGGLAET
jgi:hypothetical protein